MWRRLPILYLVAVDPATYDAVVPVYVTGDDPGRLEFTLVADQAPALAGVDEFARASSAETLATPVSRRSAASTRCGR
jgi:hypothetical protein